MIPYSGLLFWATLYALNDFCLFRAIENSRYTPLHSHVFFTYYPQFVVQKGYNDPVLFRGQSCMRQLIYRNMHIIAGILSIYAALYKTYS